MSDAAAAAAPDATVPRKMLTVLLPLGATEQHGLHLPADTDARIAAAVSTGVSARLADGGARVHTLPTLPFGASGEHAGFPGLASVGAEALVKVLVELGRSVCEWAARLVIVNAHGGNLGALHRAVPQLRGEGRDVAWCAVHSARDSSDTHAGHGETSIMLALAPETVKMSQAEPGCTRPLQELLPDMRRGGVAAVSPSGVLGDPSQARAQDGAEILDANIRALATAIAHWQPQTSGQLRPPECR